jgi:hypothetical protein
MRGWVVSLVEHGKQSSWKMLIMSCHQARQSDLQMNPEACTCKADDVGIG